MIRSTSRLGCLAGLLLAGFLAGPAFAQGIFIQRGNMAADALSLEHAVKKLAARDTGMQTLNSALQEMADYSERYTRLAQRQASYYALQRAFDPMIVRYVNARNVIETASDWRQGNPRMQDWRNVENNFDRVYNDLYGYDLLDPYFGRHPDFAAVPVRPQIPPQVLHPGWYETRQPQGEVEYPYVLAPERPTTYRLHGQAQQF
ncbi:hypothetical protein DTL42_25210 [Bremerella cremea]|uniref:Uncharacterized protein n=1 Tax=Bremerella cremea TaxID=1031537 RepID=A0A368KJK1_9BACT|nr:hypothetical protein [Bremerella cremea]RCS40669.1 hypothetical protein DTL42_25210 [Bremerella cremea]